MILSIVVFSIFMLIVNLAIDSKRFEAIVKFVNGLVLTSVALYLTLTNFNSLFLMASIALALSALGDYSLSKRKTISDGEKSAKLFVVGLGSYLVGYLFFGIPILIHFKWDPILSSIALGIFIMVNVIQFITLDKKKLQGIELPVVAYLIQATILGVASLTAFASGNVLIGIGCFSLFLSDSFIGHNLFRRPMKRPELFITPTYVVGLSMILMGIIVDLI